MPPKIQAQLTDVPVNLEAIRPLLLLLPALIPADQRMSDTLVILRYSMAPFFCDYNHAMELIFFLLEGTKQTIANDMPVPYLKGYTHLLRYKLDRQFDYIKALHAKRIGAYLNPAQTSQLVQRITETYKQMQHTMRAQEALLKTHPALGEKLDADFKFKFNHTYVETLIYKANTLSIRTQTALNALGTDFYISEMEKLLPKLNNRNMAMDFLLLNVRHALQIKHDAKQARAHLEGAKRTLTENVNDPDLQLHYHHHVTLAELSLYAYRLEHDPKKSTIPFLQKAANTALNARESIKDASEHHKGELSWMVTILLDLSLKNIRKNLLSSNIDQLKTLLTFTESLNKLLPLLVTSTIGEKVGFGSSLADSQQAQINDLTQFINQYITTLQALAVAREKEFDALNKKKADYLANFDTMVAKFNTKAKRPPSTQRKKTNPDKSREKEKEPTEEIQRQTEQATPELPTLAVYAKHYFKRVGLNNIEDLLETVYEDDYPEALIYIGDRYLEFDMINAALSAFEEAFDLAQNQTTPNEAMMDGIKMRLEEAKRKIELHIIKLEAEKKELEASKRDLIIKFGLQALKDEGATKKQRNLSNQACWQNIYNRGLIIFQNIGKEKVARGEPLSEKTLMRDEIDDYLDDLTTALNKSSNLITEIKQRRGNASIETLSNNKATLFNKGPQPTTKQNSNVKKSGKRH